MSSDNIVMSFLILLSILDIEEERDDFRICPANLLFYNRQFNVF